jgi:integrase
MTKIGLYKEKTCKGIQWRVRWFGCYDLGSGKEKRYGKTFALKKDAERFIETKKAEFKAGTKRDPSKQTLKDYTERWLRLKIQNERIRPGTATLYKETLMRLYDYFGTDRLIRKIDRNDAQDFLASLKPLSKRIDPLSAWSKHRVLRQCKTIFQKVVNDGIVSVNPFSDCQMKSGEPSEWYYLKPAEFHNLLDATKNLREKALYALAYTAGLRESETLALYWADIDFEKGRIHIVNRPATEKYPPFYIKDSDARTIPLPNMTVALLTQLQLESPDNVPFVLMDEQGCQRIKTKWQKCREQGKDWLNHYWANNVIREFHRRERQAGIKTVGKKLSVHVLRKCCIQNWANELPMNVVKELAGHSNIETTNRFYSTVDDMHYDAAKKLGDKLLSSGTTDLFLTFSGVSKENQEIKNSDISDKHL